MEINTEFIPAWLVAVSWIYTGFIWVVTRKDRIRMDSTIWGMTFIFTGLLYLSSYLPHEPSMIDETIRLQYRLMGTRVIMLLLAMSMWLPLTISHFRMVKRGIYTNGNNNSSSSSG